MDVHVVGSPDETELAALLAVLARSAPPAGLPLDRWRAGRRDALRRSTQQTR